MIFKFGDRHVVFTNHVIKVLESYKQKEKNQHESGGILLGKVYKDLILIDGVSEPSKEDKTGRYYFDRNVKRAQRIIEMAWKESMGERIYLGEWHTHPENTPLPSSDDKRLLGNMLKDSKMEIDFLFMVIMGIVNPFVAVQKKGEQTIVPLKKINSIDGLEITLYEDQEECIYGFKVIGYLELAPVGFDIYNAAFSQIFIGTINSIVSLTDISDYILEKEKGFIRFVIPNLQDEKTSILFNSMDIQITILLEEMKDKKVENHVMLKREKEF